MIRQRQTRRSRQIMMGCVMLLGVVGGLIFGLYNYALPRQNSGPQPALFTLRPTEVALSGSETPTPPATASFPHILIPTANLDEIIVPTPLEEEGWVVSNLKQRVGHLEGTAWLGMSGNIVLAGHIELSDGSAGAFKSLQDVEPGDLITMTEYGVEYRYRVTEIKKVEPTDLSVVYPTKTNRLTLITCGDYNFLRDEYESRLVVIAEGED